MFNFFAPARMVDCGRKQLIKSYVSRCGCTIDNCSHHNNLTIKDPHGRLSKSVGKVGEIERYLTAKDTKRTQRNLICIGPCDILCGSTVRDSRRTERAHFLF